MRRAATALALGLGVIGFVAPARAQEASYVELQRLSGVLNHVRLNYVDDVSYATLVRGAIGGALAALDPHSSFLSRADWLKLDALDRGTLATTGLHLDEVDGLLVVRSIEQGGPAFGAGVMTGDRLVSIDGATVEGLNSREAELRLAGEERSRVVLELERGPVLGPARFEVRLRRSMPRTRSVDVSMLLDDSTAYVSLSSFGAEAGEELERAIRSLTRAGGRRLILDLRGNPGGAVTAAADAASLFLRDGSIVFRTRGRKSDANAEHRADGNGRFRDLPLILLVDEGSASAAEALAAALQDHDRAVIAGRRTFGKALVQAPFFLQSGDVVWLTIAHLESPSGRVIQRPYRGRRVEEYRAGAGMAEEEDPPVFTTARGRRVSGGGGVRPDVWLPGPAELPVWWSEALQRGHVLAVADSLANEVRQARPDWLDQPTQREVRLLFPLLERVRAELDIGASLSPETSARLGLLLSERLVTTAWGSERGAAYRLLNDPDVMAALALFPRLREVLAD